MNIWMIGCVSVVALAAATGTAFAGCRTTAALPGQVAANSTDQRSFTLTRPGAVIMVRPVKSRDKLSLKVDRPSGAEACQQRGPSNPVVCFPTVRNKTGEGIHTIYVINKHNRPVNYKISCKN